MTRTRRHHHAQGTYDLLEERTHVLRVACPAPPDGCGAPVDQPCRQPHRPRDEREPCPPAPEGCGVRAWEPCTSWHGAPRPGLSCWRRIRAADAAHPEDAHPALPTPDPAAATEPGRRLLPVDQVRGDVAGHVEPCGWCHRRVVWAANPRGDRLPVDAEPSADGHLVLSVVADGDASHVRAHPLAHGQLDGARRHGHRLHLPHRETCPQGTRWSRHHPTRKS
ncbi:hypothetical protein [Saccharothrix lopnurensis]|uniref:Uncharacterized protein n=1 Tax=Saccharothrix lopnurensis TaxID=1670621 RepID=A0ABW1P365_9PSEU